MAPLSLLAGCDEGPQGECIFEPAQEGWACPAGADSDAGTTDAGAADAGTDGDAPDPGAPPEHLVACTSTWTGTYTCPQGLTGLTLSISHNPTNDELTALFTFYGVIQNPGVQSGCYTMEGQYDPSTRGVHLHAVEWISHPTLYFTVDLDGVYDPTKPALTGTVLGAGCTTFDLAGTAGP